MKFNTINLDISNKCSNKCCGCIRQEKGFKNNGKDMTEREMNMICDYFNNITFCGQESDPTNHPNFLNLLKICTSKNKTIDIHVAASHQSNYWWNKAFLLSKNKDVTWVFGIDGLPCDSNKYRINQDGEKLFNKMLMCSKFGIKTIWQYIVFNYNENDIDYCRKIAQQNNIHFSLVKSCRFDYETVFGIARYPMMKQLKPSEQWVSHVVDIGLGLSGNTITS